MATAGYDVVVRDLDDAFVNKGMAAIEKNLQGSVVKGKLSDAEKAAIIGRITPTTKLDPAKECQLVIEVVIERKQEKMYHFSE
jgi:3-hydroxybutyryl-CoA dehydrogenase